MNVKAKLLVLWVFVVVLITFLVTQFSHHLLFVLENCLAFALPSLSRWS